MSIFGGSKKSSPAPKPMPMPEPPKIAEAVDTAGKNVRKKAAASTKTVFTNPLGVAGQANTVKKVFDWPMIVEKYDSKYDEDILGLVHKFFNESIHEYVSDFDLDSVRDTIESYKSTQEENAYLLVVDGKCQGVLWGMAIESLFSEKQVFQEMMWYVDGPYRRYGVRMLKEAFEDLKARGFTSVVMAVLENYKAEQIKQLYKKMGFTHFETHFIKEL